MVKLLCACLAACLFYTGSVHGQRVPLTVTAYFAGDTAQLSQYDPRKITHVIFSFCHLKGARLSVDNHADTVRIQQLVALKRRNMNLKVLLSLGGWGGCPSCSDVFSTHGGRTEFAASVKALNDFFGTDGIDLDWEYPAIEGHPGHKYKPADKQNFTALVVALRNRLGKRHEISFAAGGFQKFIDEAIEWKEVMPLVDRVNLMSYDLVNGYATRTGHHTALFSNPQQRESADAAISLLLRKGVPAQKIVIGAAFYGRVWQDVPQADSGLYQAGKFKEAVGYRDFETHFPEAEGFASHWDPVARAPYLYSPSSKLFVTYDDKRSLAEKMKYVLDKKLNGIMFWEWSHDLPSNGLLDAINAARTAK